jgi:glycosyltransferase involved in cell wall biosynthesis
MLCIEQRIFMPTISIITPSFNQGRFIEKAIRSVILQEYPKIEYIIIDGGSNDESLEIIRKYEKMISYWISEPDGGQGNAINKGMEHASGDIIAWLNSDDCYTAGAFSRAAEAFQSHPGCAAVVGACRRLTPAGQLLNIIQPNKLTRDDIVDWSYGENLFYQPATFMASWAVKAAGKIREDLSIAIDYEYWLRLMKEGPFFACPHVLAEAAIYPETKSQSQRARLLSEQIRVMFEQGYADRACCIVERLHHRLADLEDKVETVKKLIPYRFLKPILRALGFPR